MKDIDRVTQFGPKAHQKYLSPNSQLLAGRVIKYVFKSTQLNIELTTGQFRKCNEGNKNHCSHGDLKAYQVEEGLSSLIALRRSDESSPQ